MAYYELRLFSKTEKHPEGYCFQVAYYTKKVLGLEQFDGCVERAKDWHKIFEAEKIPLNKRPFADFIQLVCRDEEATWLDEVATWKYQ